MGRIAKILLAALNLKESEEKEMKKKDPKEMSMPELLQALFEDMRQSEDNVTLAMAQVGLKRDELANLLEEQEALMRQAEAHEKAGRAPHAKALIADALALEKRITDCSKQLEAQDQNAQNEIVNFRNLEKEYENLREKAVDVQRQKPFIDLISRTNSTLEQFSSAVRQEIEGRLGQHNLSLAQQAARVALRSDDLQQKVVRQEGRRILEEEQIEQAYQQMRERLSAPVEVEVLLEEGSRPRLESPTDRARKLLEAPAFGGLIEPKTM